MAEEKSIANAAAGAAQPGVREISTADLYDALARGLDDFLAKPSHLVLLILIYPAVGLLLVRLTAGYDILPLVFPLITGFTLIGPLAAVGLYELSRRREHGLDFSWQHAFDIVRSPSVPAIVMVGLVQMALYFAWLGAAWVIYRLTFGNVVPVSVMAFMTEVLTTGRGWTLIIVGSGVGFLFALAVLTISVVSFPMLLDREVSALTAIQTSIRAVLANPKTMAIWGLIVAGALAAGSVLFLVGLAVVMPVLGHATWHLYRKVVAH